MLCFRLDELRHRLIPLYSYDPAEEEQEEWGDSGGEEEEELAVCKPLIINYIPPFWWVMKIPANQEFVFSLQEPLYKEGKLSFTSGYRMWKQNQDRKKNRSNWGEEFVKLQTTLPSWLCAWQHTADGTAMLFFFIFYFNWEMFENVKSHLNVRLMLFLDNKLKTKIHFQKQFVLCLSVFLKLHVTQAQRHTCFCLVISDFAGFGGSLSWNFMCSGRFLYSRGWDHKGTRGEHLH